MVTAPMYLPFFVGVNVTFITQLAFGFSVMPSLQVVPGANA
jgi:hypothetical protein